MKLNQIYQQYKQCPICKKDNNFYIGGVRYGGEGRPSLRLYKETIECTLTDIEFNNMDDIFITIECISHYSMSFICKNFQLTIPIKKLICKKHKEYHNLHSEPNINHTNQRWLINDFSLKTTHLDNIALPFPTLYNPTYLNKLLLLLQ